MPAKFMNMWALYSREGIRWASKFAILYQCGFSSWVPKGHPQTVSSHSWLTALDGHGEDLFVSLSFFEVFDRVYHGNLLLKLSSFWFHPAHISEGMFPQQANRLNWSLWMLVFPEVPLMSSSFLFPFLVLHHPPTYFAVFPMISLPSALFSVLLFPKSSICHAVLTASLASAPGELPTAYTSTFPRLLCFQFHSKISPVFFQLNFTFISLSYSESLSLLGLSIYALCRSPFMSTFASCVALRFDYPFHTRHFFALSYRLYKAHIHRMLEPTLMWSGAFFLPNQV